MYFKVFIKCVGTHFKPTFSIQNKIFFFSPISNLTEFEVLERGSEGQEGRKKELRE